MRPPRDSRLPAVRSEIAEYAGPRLPSAATSDWRVRGRGRRTRARCAFVTRPFSSRAIEIVAASWQKRPRRRAISSRSGMERGRTDRRVPGMVAEFAQGPTPREWRLRQRHQCGDGGLGNRLLRRKLSPTPPHKCGMTRPSSSSSSRASRRDSRVAAPGNEREPGRPARSDPELDLDIYFARAARGVVRLGRGGT